MDYIGGGFGSKFPADRWGVVLRQSFEGSSGGKPVKLFLDRDAELTIAGNRPSGFAKIKVGGQERRHASSPGNRRSWATGGIGGGGMPRFRTSSRKSRTSA